MQRNRMRGKNCALSRLAGKRGKILFFVRIYDMLYCGGNAAIRRCAHKRRRLLFTRYPECRARAIFSWNLVLPGMLEGRKGGCTMTFEQVVLLLTLLGGAIYVTFEITWTVSHSDDKKKK